MHCLIQIVEPLKIKIMSRLVDLFASSANQIELEQNFDQGLKWSRGEEPVKAAVIIV